MRSLVLVAHGSRRAAANAEVKELTQQVAQRAGARYGSVSNGFLEMAQPDIPTAIQQAIDAGATELIVVPYFLSAGQHVTEDIPQIVKRKQDEYPAVPMMIAPYLGVATTIPDLLLALAETPLPDNTRLGATRPSDKISPIPRKYVPS